MAYVIQQNTTVKDVKNLGWLLRNWKLIDGLEWVDSPRKGMGGIFRAYLKDGRIFTTAYADFTVWKRFVNRPVFRGLPVKVNHFIGEV